MEMFPIVSNLDNCWLQVNSSAPKRVVIFVDSPQYYERYEDYDLKVAVICEPNELLDTNNVFTEWQSKFDVILTWDEELLKLPNARLFLQPYSAHWIDVLNYNKWDKDYSVSTVVGGKRQTIGHAMRHDLYFRQNEITVPKRFFCSSRWPLPNTFNNPYLGETKVPLFDSMFHICIENVGRRKHAITEKLIDTLVTKTVPIHWGCTNLGDYFDTDGILIAETIDDIIKISNSLTPELYYKMLPNIENNFRHALKYYDIRVNLIKMVKVLIQEKFGICY